MNEGFRLPLPPIKVHLNMPTRQMGGRCPPPRRVRPAQGGSSRFGRRVRGIRSFSHGARGAGTLNHEKLLRTAAFVHSRALARPDRSTERGRVAPSSGRGQKTITWLEHTQVAPDHNSDFDSWSEGENWFVLKRVGLWRYGGRMWDFYASLGLSFRVGMQLCGKELCQFVHLGET